MRIEVQEWNEALGASLKRFSSQAGSGRQPSSFHGWVPRIDLLESPTHLLLRADLAGVVLKNVNLLYQRDRNTLTLRGVRFDDFGRSQEKVRPLVLEIEHGEFARVLALPNVDLDLEGASAQLRDGILTVVLPKIDVRTPSESADQIIVITLL